MAVAFTRSMPSGKAVQKGNHAQTFLAAIKTKDPTEAGRAIRDGHGTWDESNNLVFADGSVAVCIGYGENPWREGVAQEPRNWSK